MSAYNLPEKHTIGDFICAVLKISNEEDAREFYGGCVASIQRTMDRGEWKSTATAEEAAKSNIGWCYGEGMPRERRAMWAKVCGAAHPVFGNVSASPAELMAAGARALGKLQEP